MTNIPTPFTKSNNSKAPVPLVNITRSGTIECTHRGSIVIVENGNLIDYIGDANTITPMRSTAKPFQILPLLENPMVEEYELSLKEIATMVSSHNGEHEHVNVVKNILNKIELNEVALNCGTHPAYFSWITEQIFHEIGTDAQPIHNNCSGKHAGMLLLCKLLGVPMDQYWHPDHPIQQSILRRIADILETKSASVSVGVDGCGVPTYNVTLTQLANTYYKIAIADSLDDTNKLGLVRKAMMEEPFMVAGSNRLDTDLMKLGSFVAKVGSQGIYCVAVPAKQIAIAIKIESGSEEAGECAAVEMLRKLGLLSEQQLQLLDKYWHRPVLTYTGMSVGSYKAIF